MVQISQGAEAEYAFVTEPQLSDHCMITFKPDSAVVGSTSVNILWHYLSFPADCEFLQPHLDSK
jgi:hypothetical protein